MKITRLFNRKNVWIFLGLVAIAVRWLMSPTIVEAYYSRGVFQWIRRFFDFVTNILPFALVYLLFFMLLGWLLFVTVRFFKNKQPWKIRLLRLAYSIVAFAGGFVFFFLSLWGYNYGRIPLEQTMGLVPKPLSIEELKAELVRSTSEVSRLRELLPGVSQQEVSDSLLPMDLENTMRFELYKTLNDLGYSPEGKVRARLLYPKGILLRISTAGIYIPFTGEGHVDAGLHHLQIPFVIVHEMSHGMGFGDEGTCNFLAYLACMNSEIPYLNYLGELYYWRYVAANYQKYQPEDFEDFWEHLPEGMLNDLLSIRKAIEQYPDILPDIRDAAYNAYLQSQGVRDGIQNYDRVIMMVHALKSGEK